MEAVFNNGDDSVDDDDDDDEEEGLAKLQHCNFVLDQKTKHQKMAPNGPQLNLASALVEELNKASFVGKMGQLVLHSEALRKTFIKAFSGRKFDRKND